MIEKKVKMFLIMETLDDHPGKMVSEFDNINDLNDHLLALDSSQDNDNLKSVKIVSGIVLEERHRTIDA